MARATWALLAVLLGAACCSASPVGGERGGEVTTLWGGYDASGEGLQVPRRFLHEDDDDSGYSPPGSPAPCPTLYKLELSVMTKPGYRNQRMTEREMKRTLSAQCSGCKVKAKNSYFRVDVWRKELMPNTCSYSENLTYRITKVVVSSKSEADLQALGEYVAGSFASDLNFCAAKVVGELEYSQKEMCERVPGRPDPFKPPSNWPFRPWWRD